jgi:Flp pilus assembly protein TadG
LLSGKYSQKGIVVVLAAVLTPLLMMCGGVGLDLGNTYLHKAQLQNIADAAVLAGGWSYSEKENQVDAKNTINYYVNQNRGITSSNPLECTTEFTSNNTNTIIRLTVQEDLPTFFLQYFGMKTIALQSRATANYAPATSSDPGAFDFGMIAGYNKKASSTTSYDDNQILNTNGIYFHTDGIKIDGMVHSNGGIYLHDNHYATITANGSLTTAYSNASDIWANYRDVNQWEKKPQDIQITTDTWRHYYTMGDQSSNDLSFTNTGNIDISLSETNTNTKSMWDYVQNIKKQYQTNPAQAQANHIYYDDTADKAYQFDTSHTNEYPSLTSGSITYAGDGGSWNVWNQNYKFIVVDGNLDINIPNGLTPGTNDYVVLVSLHGNIHLQNNSVFHGIIYAPNGTILMDGACDILGSIVGEHIEITTGGQKINVKQSSFNFNSGSSTTNTNKKAQVTLIE